MIRIRQIVPAAAFLAALSFSAPAFAEDAVPVEPVEPAEPVIVVKENNWEKFKAGARVAGEAIADGTKNTAHKVADGAERAGDAVVRGSKKAGHAIADKYEDAKDYVEEKIDD